MQALGATLLLIVALSVQERAAVLEMFMFDKKKGEKDICVIRS